VPPRGVPDASLVGLLAERGTELAEEFEDRDVRPAITAVLRRYSGLSSLKFLGDLAEPCLGDAPLLGVYPIGEHLLVPCLLGQEMLGRQPAHGAPPGQSCPHDGHRSPGAAGSSWSIG
jgi:hypothetical protein